MLRRLVMHAPAGGRSPHRISTSRLDETTVFASANSAARTTRCCAPPTWIE